MRKDFSKLFHEPGRRGGGYCRKGRAISQDLDDQPSYESTRVKQRSWNKKEESRAWAVLYRWLRSHCGQLWDKVYSEASEALDCRSIPKNRTKKALEGAVIRRAFRHRDGRVHYYPNYRTLEQRQDDSIPVDGRYSCCHFYVEPETGILREADRRDTKVRKEEEPPSRIDLSGEKHLYKIEKIWYEFHVLPSPQSPETPSVVIGKERVFYKAKRQLGSKELKAFRIRNG